jgi:hypothetical protein
MDSHGHDSATIRENDESPPSLFLGLHIVHWSILLFRGCCEIMTKYESN